MAGLFLAAEVTGREISPPPPHTAMGALLHHITAGARAETFQPMNVHFGLFPPIQGKIKGRERKKSYTRRAIPAFDAWRDTWRMTHGADQAAL